MALKPSDTFLCSCFIIGEPLYFDNFVRGHNPPTLFVVGNKGGLMEVRRGWGSTKNVLIGRSEADAVICVVV